MSVTWTTYKNLYLPSSTTGDAGGYLVGNLKLIADALDLKAASSLLAGYLPLTGGTLAGSLNVMGLMTANGFSGDGSRLTTLSASALATGIVPAARLGTGFANSGTYLRGDGTWSSFPTPAMPTLDGVLSAGNTSGQSMSVGNLTAAGRVEIDADNGDYSNDPASAALYISNSNAYGQNLITTSIGGNVVGKWRTDYAGNITWAAGNPDVGGTHDFFVGGDYPDGVEVMSLHADGIHMAAPAITFASGGQITDDGNGGVLVNSGFYVNGGIVGDFLNLNGGSIQMNSGIIYLGSTGAAISEDGYGGVNLYRGMSTSGNVAITNDSSSEVKLTMASYSSAVSPTNVMYTWSRRTNGDELWLYGNNGTTYKNLLTASFASGAVNFPNDMGVAGTLRLNTGGVGTLAIGDGTLTKSAGNPFSFNGPVLANASVLAVSGGGAHVNVNLSPPANYSANINFGTNSTPSVIYSTGNSGDLHFSVAGSDRLKIDYTGAVTVSSTLTASGLVRANGGLIASNVTVGSTTYQPSGELNAGAGSYTDPAPGSLYDAKFGGSVNGIAVRGPSAFRSSVEIDGNANVYNTLTVYGDSQWFVALHMNGRPLQQIGGTSTDDGSSGWNGTVTLAGGASLTVKHGLIVAADGYTGTNDDGGGGGDGGGGDQGGGDGGGGGTSAPTLFTITKSWSCGVNVTASDYEAVWVFDTYGETLSLAGGDGNGAGFYINHSAGVGEGGEINTYAATEIVSLDFDASANMYVALMAYSHVVSAGESGFVVSGQTGFNLNVANSNTLTITSGEGC